MAIVGIDLGTTYSVVAIPEERRGDGFFVARGCPGCSVITDRLKQRLTPSVVAEDERGQVLVGHPAKSRAGMAPPPIMFAKRAMGKDTTFPLGKRGAVRPEEVSAHVLRYLKQLAEERLGEKVEEAVITVPAYFKSPAKSMTEKAGELAGLRVAQIVQEPVAAALMYCAADPRDPLRIMTYDLGGGTFDIAILEKRDGTISTHSILAFDGDPFLGGYDFDKALVAWMVGKLNGMGFDLRFEENNPDDRVAYAKLLVFAEQVKIELSGAEFFHLQKPSTGITDRRGNPVALDLEVTRDDFEALIRTQIDYTMQLCHRARTEKAKRPIGKDEIDEIVMVGGSSRIPMVARRLEEEFGKKPKLIEPDLCVALGAAILAGTKAKTFGCLKLDPIPAQTDMPSLPITGRVVPSEQVRTVAGCQVALRAQDGSVDLKRSTGTEGAFAFPDVKLAPEKTTEFTLTVTAPGAGQVAQHRFAVRRSATASGGGLIEAGGTNVLAKPVSILWVDGPEEVAPARTPLPFKKVVHARTADTSGEIRVPILEDNTPLGTIHMKNIPAGTAVGTAVEVTVELHENYQVTGTASIPSLKLKQEEVIEIPVPRIPSVEELRDRYERLQQRARDAQNSANRGALFGDPNVKVLKERMRECQEQLDATPPDCGKIDHQLDEIEGLIRTIGAGWKPDPPKAAFDQKVCEAEELLDRLVQQKPEKAKDGYDKRLAAIRQEADKAYTGQNSAAWKEACGRVAKLCDELEGMLQSACGGGGGAQQPQDPAALLVALGQNLAKLAQYAKDQGKFAKFKDEFREAGDALKRIDPRAADAMAQIRDWYYTRYEELRKKLDAPESTGLLERQRT